MKIEVGMHLYRNADAVSKREGPVKNFPYPVVEVDHKKETATVKLLNGEDWIIGFPYIEGMDWHDETKECFWHWHIAGTSDDSLLQQLLNRKEG